MDSALESATDIVQNCDWKTISYFLTILNDRLKTCKKNSERIQVILDVFDMADEY